MDQGILECLKRKYRKTNLKDLLRDENENVNIVQMQKQIDLLQVCHNISNSWEQVEVSTLKNAYNKLF